MAGSLTIRLTQTDPDESRNIAIAPFIGALYRILGGYHTVAQVKTYYSMTVADATQFDLLIAEIDITPDLTQKQIRIENVRSILTFWEQSDDIPISGYTTPDEIETKFLAIGSFVG